MSAFLGVQGSQIALLAGVALLVFVLLKRLLRGFGQSASRPRYTASSRATGRPAERREIPLGSSVGSARLRSATASKEQESWEVEMHALARQLKGEIDTRLRALERLIQTADRAKSALEAAVERAESLGALNDGSTGDSLAASCASGEWEASAIRARASDDGSRRAERTKASIARAWSGERMEDDPRFERVYALADAGFSATRIAGQVGSQVGEVELILSLRHSVGG